MASCSDNTCGIGGWGGPLPGDPSNNSILSATPAFGGIDVSWSYPDTNPQAVAHTLLYRGLLPDFNSALQIQVVAGNFFYDKIDTPIRYYYWIRIVSVNGTIGELIGPASAVAKPTIAGVIEQLTGMIDAGLLSQTLKLKLDEISLLNQNLLNEITARENSEVTLAEALELVNEGVAEAMTFIHEEINSRTTADSAIAEQLNILAATLGDQYAAVIQTMRVDINTLTGKTNAIWSAQVNVNGMIGGFGLVGDGTTVEAGFDVDRFWIGRTNAQKRKPFIIDGEVVYIDDAAIRSLTFSKLRDEAGSFVVENGKLKASYISATSLSAITAETGQLSMYSFNGDWAFLRTGSKWWGDGQYGFIMAQHPSGDQFLDFSMAGCGLQMFHDAGVSASFRMWGPGFNLDQGGLTINQANVIGTLQIAGEAVTVARWGQGVNNTFTEFVVPDGQYWESMSVATWGIGAEQAGGYVTDYNLTGLPTVQMTATVSRTYSSESGDTFWYRSPPLTRAVVLGHGAGYHRINATGSGDCVLTTMIRKR